MLLLKLLQSLVKALNSDGTPGQVAAGIALGAVFGLTPLMNLHNLVLWTWAYNTPVVALTNFNNTIVLGSFVVWAAALLPLFFLLRWVVTKYRATVYARLQRTKLFKAVKASKVYNLYTLFRP
jgi:uncharacterized protein (DUF2062 family)